jgi:hypothetical protein
LFQVERRGKVHAGIALVVGAVGVSNADLAMLKRIASGVYTEADLERMATIKATAATKDNDDDEGADNGGGTGDGDGDGDGDAADVAKSPKVEHHDNVNDLMGTLSI